MRRDQPPPAALALGAEAGQPQSGRAAAAHCPAPEGKPGLLRPDAGPERQDQLDAAKPLDLLGNTRHPGAARRACNAVRTARNEAAHAADAQDAAQAALLFNEAIESLEEGYADTAFRENELAQYYREAESFLEQCGARKAARPADNTRGQSKAAKPAARTGSRTSGGKASNNSRTAARKRSAPARRGPKKKRTGNRTILTLLLVVLVLGLLLRALHMGVL